MGAKTKFKSLWSILLALVMVVGMMPTTALAEGETPTQATATADFSTDSTTALALLNAVKTGTEDSTWDSSTNTLTLNGVNFITTNATAVKLPDGTTIVLNGVNTITSTFSGSGNSFGIQVVFDDTSNGLTIQGPGTLNVTGGTAAGVYSRSCGIFSSTAVTISGGKVEAIGGKSDKLSLGIYSLGSLTISGDADVTGIGGTATDDGSFGISSEGEVKISGGKVKAIGGAGKGSDGIYSGNGIVTISGGKVEAIGGDAPIAGGSVGIFAQTSGANVTITGTADVTARGGKSASDRSYGIYSINPVTVSGGKVEAFGGEGRYPGYGIDEANISGGTVTAASEDGEAIYDVNFKGSGFKTISFDGNGGSGEMIAYTNADSYPLPANGFTAPAYKQLKGWKVGEENKTVGSNITISADTTVEAVWGDAEYNVTVNGGTASVSKAAAGTTVTLTANEAPSGQVFDQWVVESGSASITLTNANRATTTFEMPGGDVIVKATYAIPISSVAITGIDTPVSNTILDSEAVCETTGVSTTTPTVIWDTDESQAGYDKDYTASVTLTAVEGYKFTDDVTAIVNNGSATSVTKNANGTLTVTYKFPKTDKHNIEITVDTEIRDGDTAKNPTINSGYGFEFCFFVEDADKDGVFMNETTSGTVLDDKTFVVDKALVEEFAAQSEGSFTYESLMAALKREFGLDELKTEFTSGYDYSVFAYIGHSDGAYFDYDDDGKVTNAIVKVNGEDITDSCQGDRSGMFIMPGAYVFTATKTYTITVTDGKATAEGASVSKAAEGTKVTLTANAAPSGKVFDKWVVVGGGITLANANSMATTFTMPAGAVSVKATYKNAPETTPVPAAKGKVITDKLGNSYKVTKSDAKTGEVTFAKPKSGIKGTVKVPDTVTIGGITYKVTAIGANAFKNNKKIKTVKLAATVTSIGDKAFYKCRSLTSITIPSKVTKIGKSAFEGCKKLKTITVKSTKLKSVGKKALKGIHAKAKIKVPKSKLKKYKSLFKKKGQGKKVKVTK